MSSSRAARYRVLALKQSDPAKAKLLRSIADEAERGVLVTTDWMGSAPVAPRQPVTEPGRPDGKPVDYIWKFY